MKDRRGFSLVELLVVAVLGTLILMATYGVLITNQRTHTVNTARMMGQQTVRAGMDLLFSELREISPGGGDLLAMEDDEVTIRVMRTTGLICTATTAGESHNYRWGMVIYGDTFRVGDSIWVFAEKNPATTDDDVWFRTRVDAIHSPGDCGDYTTQRIRFPWGPQAGMPADTPTVGTLVRAYQTYTYGLGSYQGQPYLIRKLEPAGAVTPLVGPLMAGSGVSFEYLDADGNTTGTAANVRQVLVTVRTQHQARDAQGNLIVDSLTARIFTRN